MVHRHPRAGPKCEDFSAGVGTIGGSFVFRCIMCALCPLDRTDLALELTGALAFNLVWERAFSVDLLGSCASGISQGKHMDKPRVRSTPTTTSAHSNALILLMKLRLYHCRTAVCFALFSLGCSLLGPGSSGFKRKYVSLSWLAAISFVVIWHRCVARLLSRRFKRLAEGNAVRIMRRVVVLGGALGVWIAVRQAQTSPVPVESRMNFSLEVFSDRRAQAREWESCASRDS